jgi:5-formyltetrahydrofolate cyclo-ligase
VSKEALRQKIRQEQALHGEPERKLDSARICALIREQPVWKSSRSVLFFWPLATEPDLRPLCQEAIGSGKIVAFPKYLPASACYAAVRVSNLQTGLVAGQFGIFEPASVDAELWLNVLDLIFVPGVAFSFDGARLGRGKGYYDRLLGKVTGTRCGVAFDWQITNEIPTEAHDIRLSCLATPTQWRESGFRP